MASKTFSYTFPEGSSSPPAGTVARWTATYPDPLPKGATSMAVSVRLDSIEAPGGENVRDWPSVRLALRHGPATLGSAVASFNWSEGADTASVAIGVRQPIKGARGEPEVALEIEARVQVVSWSGNASSTGWTTAASWAVATPNDDSMLVPELAPPAGADPLSALSPSGSIPEGWPIVSGLPGAAVAVELPSSWIETYGAEAASVSVALSAAGTTARQSLALSDGSWRGSVAVPYAPSGIAASVDIADAAGRQATASLGTVPAPAYRAPVPSAPMSAERCRDDGASDDEGPAISATASWSAWTPAGASDGSENSASATVSLYGASGTEPIASAPAPGGASVVLGAGLVQPEEEYRVLWSVSDATGTTVEYGVEIEQAYSTIDLLAGGRGIAFGKTAEREEFECAMASRFLGTAEFDGKVGAVGPTTRAVWDGSALSVEAPAAFRRFGEAAAGLSWDPVAFSASLAAVMRLKAGSGFVKASHTPCSWIAGPGAAPFQADEAHAGNSGSLWPLASVKSQNGRWCVGALGDGLEVYYVADSRTANSTDKRVTIAPTANSQAGWANAVLIDGIPIWKILYPVGAVYFSYSPTSPASLFGGTWAQLTGRFVRMANDVSTGGADTHKHNSYDSSDPAGSLLGRYEQGGGKYAYYKYVSANAWTTNYHMSGNGTGGISQSKSTGMEIQGHTAAASSLPPYQDLYAWRRTA